MMNMCDAIQEYADPKRLFILGCRSMCLAVYGFNLIARRTNPLYPCRDLQPGNTSESESSDDEPGVRRSAITGKKIRMRLENQTTEDHARAAGRKHLLQFMNSQF